MINPLRKLTARGVIWYQGEGHKDGYADLLKSMIGAWRREFETPNLYFAVVQLPRFKDQDTWYYCREEDKKVASMVDNVTYGVNIDTGMYPEMTVEGDPINADAIHPYEKEPVGTRLADAVMQKFYGAEGVWRGPVISTAKIVNGQLQLTFDNVGSGLKLTGELAGFEVCGADGQYYDAVPKLINGKTVALTCSQVTDPVKVRYGYKNYSSLITKPITSCSQSVSLYNTKGTERKIAYPAEQFWVDITK
jgi:sialate O-acetylesterase